MKNNIEQMKAILIIITLMCSPPVHAFNIYSKNLTMTDTINDFLGLIKLIPTDDKKSYFDTHLYLCNSNSPQSKAVQESNDRLEQIVMLLKPFVTIDRFDVSRFENLSR